MLYCYFTRSLGFACVLLSHICLPSYLGQETANDLSIFESSCHQPICLPRTVEASHCSFNCWTSSREAANIYFYSLWFDPTGNRTQLYRFSSRLFDCVLFKRHICSFCTQQSMAGCRLRCWTGWLLRLHLMLRAVALLFNILFIRKWIFDFRNSKCLKLSCVAIATDSNTNCIAHKTQSRFSTCIWKQLLHL